MSEPRRHSTRHRGEPPMKLRKVSPEPPKVDVSSPPTTSRKPGRPRKVEPKETPSKLTKVVAKTKGKDSPRPATPARSPEATEGRPEQTEDISTLIEKSRQRWVNEGGVFEKFWTKPPRKKKGQPAPEMPSKQQMNMQDLGSARLIIEPHVFDVQLWGVKKPALTWQPPIEATSVNGTKSATPGPAASHTPARPVPQNPYVRPTTGTPPQPAAIQPVNQRGIAPNPYAMPSAQNTPSQKQTPQTQQSPASTATAPIPNTIPGHNPVPVPAQQSSVTIPQPQAQTQPQPQQPGAPHPDPVIQMLAQRAAGDPVLKELMKVVAAGSESPEKLAEFQRHINEITEIVKQQQLARAQRAQMPQAQNAQQGQGSKQQFRSTQYIQSKPAAPPARVEYSQLAFDFVRTADCYAFPQRSIIQHMPDGTTTKISFIFTRMGKDVPVVAGSSRLKPEVEYYQPFTFDLLTTDPRHREALTQVFDKPNEVSKAMSEMMEKYTLAPDVAAMLEAASMPTKGKKRDAQGAERAEETIEDEVGSLDAVNDDVLKMEWAAPNSLLPMRR